MNEEIIPSDRITIIQSPRIHYEDIETGLRRPKLERRGSIISELSVRSLSRKSIDPATLIPIEYRTV